MNYIGSKLSLINFIEETIEDVLKKNNETKTWDEIIFGDLFAGTGVVGSTYKKKGCTIISNDLQYYSYCLNKHLIGNNSELNFKNLEEKYIELNIEEDKIKFVLSKLEELSDNTGFIYKNYCLGGTQGKEFERMYFSDENGMKCDAIRNEIEFWRKQNLISESEYFFLISTLLESIDSVANTASVYGAFLKNLKKSAIKNLKLKKLDLILSNKEHKVYNEDINELIKIISGDILYLDPPYNNRQYAPNYHILETIARNDNPAIRGKTGLRDYSSQKSSYSTKNSVSKAFELLISNADFKYIFLSYNCEGLMSLEEIKMIMSKYGEYELYFKGHKRFKADKDGAREHKKDSTTEYLHCLVKRGVKKNSFIKAELYPVK